MKIVIIGNGSIGMMTAFELLQRNEKCQISLVGKQHRPGSASLAAAAMFNSFCEIDKNTLGSEFETAKFEFNKAATPFWPETIKKLGELAQTELNHGFGTVLINNHCTDSLEDENFDAIIAGLKKYNEPYEKIETTSIRNYKPSERSRGSRAILIPGEGWINPVELIGALNKYVSNSPDVTTLDSEATSLHAQSGKIDHVVLENGEKVSGDVYIVCPGATFSKVMDNSNFDLKLPRIFYGVGCSILLKTGEETMDGCVRTPNRGLACGIYSAPQNSSHTVVGASNFISPTPEENVRLTSIHTLVDASIKQLNHNFYRAQLVKVNVGWRPTSEDTIPLIGKTSIENMIVATGTKRDGLHCSPLISQCLSALIFGEKPPYDLSLFTPERAPHRIVSREKAVEISVRNIINAAYQHGFEPPMNRMVDELEDYYRQQIESIHDKAGAVEWGIPPEMINMYKYGHATI